MARIRTIKPDFWTDEKLTECSLSARLLFIGTWNFADDNGNLDRSAKQIKARVFPLDNIECEPLLQELLYQGLMIEYRYEGKLFLHINGFGKHQLINRPSKPTCPLYEPSLSTQVTLITEGKGEEWKGRDKNIVRNDVADCPHSEIINLYAKNLPMLTQVREWTNKRQSLLKSRWRESMERQNLEWWDRFFAYVATSDFLTGKSTTWQADIEWLLNASNIVKVIEGKYENKAAA